MAREQEHVRYLRVEVEIVELASGRIDSKAEDAGLGEASAKVGIGPPPLDNSLLVDVVASVLNQLIINRDEETYCSTTLSSIKRRSRALGSEMLSNSALWRR